MQTICWTEYLKCIIGKTVFIMSSFTLIVCARQNSFNKLLLHMSYRVTMPLTLLFSIYLLLSTLLCSLKQIETFSTTRSLPTVSSVFRKAIIFTPTKAKRMQSCIAHFWKTRNFSCVTGVRFLTQYIQIEDRSASQKNFCVEHGRHR